MVSIYNAGAFHTNGRGTPRDLTQALAWLLVAKHYRIDHGQAQPLQERLAKNQPGELKIAEARSIALIAEIETARRNLK